VKYIIASGTAIHIIIMIWGLITASKELLVIGLTIHYFITLYVIITVDCLKIFTLNKKEDNEHD